MSELLDYVKRVIGSVEPFTLLSNQIAWTFDAQLCRGFRNYLMLSESGLLGHAYVHVLHLPLRHLSFRKRELQL